MASKGATRKGVSKGTKKRAKGAKTALAVKVDLAKPLANRLHERFAIEYLRARFNGTEAYMNAYGGSQPATARANAYRLLTNADVRGRVEYLAREALASERVSAMQVIQGFARVASLDPGRAFDTDGNLLAVPDMPDDVRLAIAGMEVVVNAKGQHTKKIRFNDRIGALAGLAKVLKMDLTETPPADAEVLKVEEARRTAVLERIAKLGERLAGQAREPITIPG